MKTAAFAFCALFWLALPGCNPPEQKLLQDSARLRSDRKILEIFDSGDSYPLSRAAYAGDAEALEGLLKISSLQQMLNERETSGSGSYTPLMFAAMKGRAAAISVLLGAGADPNIKDSQGAGALIWAAYNGSAGAVEALLKAEGIKIDERDSDGLTALAQAAIKGRAAAVSALLGAGADPDITDNEGRSAIFYAAKSGRADIMGMLLSAGASPNLTDSLGRTPLMAAAYGGEIPALKKLLEIPAATDKINERGKDGKTAFDLAKEEGHAELAGILQEAGGASGAAGAGAVIFWSSIKGAIKSFLKKRAESERRIIAAEKGAESGRAKSKKTSVFQKIADFFKNLF